jgi:hypothetical protein
MIARPALAFAFACGLTACGPGAPAGPVFPIELYVSAGLNDQLSAFQVSLVTNGTSLDCFEVQKTCIKDQVDAARFVKLKDASGRQVQAVSFPLSLTAGMPSSQDLTLKELPIGKNFALVIEALSKDPTPKLAGSSCNYVKELTAGNNPAVPARIELLTPAASCDPRH